MLRQWGDLCQAEADRQLFRDLQQVRNPRCEKDPDTNGHVYFPEQSRVVMLLSKARQIKRTFTKKTARWG